MRAKEARPYLRPYLIVAMGMIAATVLILAVALLALGCGTTDTTTTTTAAPPTTQTTAAGGPGGGAPVQFVIDLTGAEAVPPVDTSASGTFSLFVEGGPSPSGQIRISYKLEVKDIVDATAAHIHLGAKGAEGPVIVPLFTGPTKTGSFSGVLAEGSIAESDLTGPMEGKTFADLTAAVLAGQTYVNVHTKANPNGEIRGQIVVPGIGAGPGTTAAGAGSTTTGAPSTSTSASGGYRPGRIL